MKGLILAGGTGTRLWPITKGVSKQLLPIHDKPLIYYPLSTLLLAGIRDIILVTTAKDQDSFKSLFGDGEHLGITISYIVQNQPNGIGESFILAEKLIKDCPVSLILGDNIFHGSGVGRNLQQFQDINGAHVFSYQVANPQDFGVVEINSGGKPVSIVEKPTEPKSNFALTGLYFYDKNVTEIAKSTQRSARGELEISTINQRYLEDELLEVSILPRGTAWFDGGTVDSLHDAGEYVRVVEKRQGLKIGCVEEIAWRNGWINDSELIELASMLKPTEYGKYLEGLLISK
jgi:glucose-1-phosphate thymidylyltransferase